MKKTISQRIKEGLEIRGMKQSELVEITGIGKSSISTYISGAYEPKQKNIYKIAKALNVNEAWLMGLDVEMDRVTTINKLDVTQDELNLLDNYKKLNELGKNEANKRVAELTEINKYVCETSNEISATTDNVTEVDFNSNNKEDDEEVFVPYKSLDEFECVASHYDDLTEEEKIEADRRVLEFLNKRKLAEFNKRKNNK